jgi:hypothetical protein
MEPFSDAALNTKRNTLAFSNQTRQHFSLWDILTIAKTQMTTSRNAMFPSVLALAPSSVASQLRSSNLLNTVVTASPS